MCFRWLFCSVTVAVTVLRCALYREGYGGGKANTDGHVPQVRHGVFVAVFVLEF